MNKVVTITCAEIDGQDNSLTLHGPFTDEQAIKFANEQATAMVAELRDELHYEFEYDGNTTIGRHIIAGDDLRYVFEVNTLFRP